MEDRRAVPVTVQRQERTLREKKPGDTSGNGLPAPLVGPRHPAPPSASIGPAARTSCHSSDRAPLHPVVPAGWRSSPPRPPSPAPAKPPWHIPPCPAASSLGSDHRVASPGQSSFRTPPRSPGSCSISAPELPCSSSANPPSTCDRMTCDTMTIQNLVPQLKSPYQHRKPLPAPGRPA